MPRPKKSKGKSGSRPDKGYDVLVQWHLNGANNIVHSPLLQWTGKMTKGKEVIMDYEGTLWQGIVLDSEYLEDSESSDEEFDIPLARLSDKYAEAKLGPLPVSSPSLPEDSTGCGSGLPEPISIASDQITQSDEEFDIPLARLSDKYAEAKLGPLPVSSPSLPEDSTGCGSGLPEPISIASDQITQSDSHADSPLHPNMQCGQRNPETCDNFMCTDEVWAACPECLCFLCFLHFNLRDDCLCHNLAFNLSEIPLDISSSASQYQGLTNEEERNNEDEVMPLMESRRGNFENQASLDTRVEENGDQVLMATLESKQSDATDSLDIPEHLEEASLPQESADNSQLSPESFQVDGERALEVPEQPKTVKSRNQLVKERRNAGYSYESEKSKELKAARRFASYETSCEKCHFRGLSCNTFSCNTREAIRSAFYDLADLTKQREWIGRHTEQIQEKKSRKIRKCAYFLPMQVIHALKFVYAKRCSWEH
ncbi:uncharacterized protein LOC105436801 [Strongylocentrotus purpuratus]|uniref:Uncharacterized protein n=1 Tax=Strongylocentrotus purpuratus TaxID=7668 RepID=A0A7M7N7C0_STRPU|nr:uncharacterized protein LOC105436801 [Strongylocentrotus purpuratus]